MQFRLFQQLQDFSNVGAFAFGWAGFQLRTMQTITGTGLGTGLPLLKDRAIVQIGKFTDFKRQGAVTGMIEEEQALFQNDPISLITDQNDLLVGKKIIPGFPLAVADSTLFEYVTGHQKLPSLLNLQTNG